MRSKTRLIIVTLFMLVVLVGLAACSGKTAAPAQVNVTRGDIVQSASADGELSLPQQRKLSFGVDGKIEAVNVEEGANVKKGDVLAKLETSTLERVVKTADLGVSSAQADQQQAEAGLNTARAALKQAEFGVKAAEADQKQAELGISASAEDLKQAEIGVKTAQANLELANDTFRKITYPYTYSTFAFDVPQAVDSINTAQRQMGEALKVLQTAGLTAEQYMAASRQLQDALDNLTMARQRLDRGQGTDPIMSGLLAVKDYWTLRDAQLGMEKAALGVETANGTLNSARLAVDIARGVADKAQLSTEVAKAALESARAGVSNAEGILNKAKLAVSKARYDLDTAKETLAKATIAAPFDGVVAEVNVKIGDVLTVADYARTIFKLVDPRRMEFTLKVDEMDIPGVDLGQVATVSVDALPNAKVEGKVISIAPLPKVEGGVVRYEVKIGFDVPAGLSLKSGVSSTANILISKRQNVLLVPSQAISRTKSGESAVKLLVNGQSQEKVVRLGVSSGAQTEILSGLNEGDIVAAVK